MTDCAKTLDFFAAWKRMCQEQHGACRACWQREYVEGE